jgi:hypothetical protein
MTDFSVLQNELKGNEDRDGRFGRELRSIFQIKFELTFFPAGHRPTFK